MSAPSVRGGGGRGRGGPRRPQAPRTAVPNVVRQQFASTDSTPLPSGAVTPAAEGGSGVRFRDFEGLSEEVLKGIPFEFCTEVRGLHLRRVRD
jgi:ATP-dependent RNA helicase MSS116